MAQHGGWNFAESIPDILTADESASGPHIDTFSAHHLGYCPRQLYLAQLGLRDESETQGRLQAGRLIHEFVEESLSEYAPDLAIDPGMASDHGPLRFVGRPTAYDPENGIVCHVKPRNGWYKFHPPNDRHLDQLAVYMQGLDADGGQLIYISMSDLRDVRTWPTDGTMSADPARFERIVDRANAVRNRILSDGVPSSEAEIPFEQCGCFLCENETIEFPEPTESTDTLLDTGIPEAENHADGGTESRIQPGEALDLPTREPEVLQTDCHHVPTGLQELDLWVVWDGREKRPLAPWQTDSMYPCRWSADGSADPRGSYRRAKMVAELPVKELHRQWPFPDGENLPDEVQPAVLLPHDPTEVGITVVDFDAVRDPETGRVDGSALELLDRMDTYAEVSTSGCGLHAFLLGTLPNGSSSVSMALPGGGRIELYDHSRFIASTWRHVEGCRLNDLSHSEGLLAELAS